MRPSALYSALYFFMLFVFYTSIHFTLLK